MQCARCHHANRPGAKFCEECATPLVRACANCGAQLSSTAKFCPDCAHPAGQAAAARFTSPGTYTPQHLAEKILTSKVALEGERKQVTVLFADLKGSMELLADRDPEEARKILDPVLERMMDAIHYYEGTVNQVMGDGIMALFGAPLAHEDHAVRACYAALRMQDAVRRYSDDLRRAQGVEVQIRIGLNSGEVVVRSIRSDLRTDYTAVGQTTHLAARMEQLATPGTVRLTGETVRLAEGYVEVRSLGPIPVKGLTDPIKIFELTGAGQARTRLQAAALRGLTRFVGRDAELEQLRRAQQRAGDGHGQIVAVVGEAGVGKSRLVHEITHSHSVQGGLVLESTSVSYGKATGYLPVIDLLKGYFKIQDRDDLREVRQKVTGKLLTLDRALEPTLPALLALLDVPVDDAEWSTLDPAQRRQRTLDAVERLLMREAREQPVLLIFEDLHWIDGETQALLDSLVDSLGSARLLLLVNYRPEYQHPWGSRTSYSQIRLDALQAESARELLEALLGDDPGLAALKQLFVKRGNPFFLEETVRTLVETKALIGEPGRYRLGQPVQTMQVPATVQTMLAARIDRLAPEDKRLLQIASVVGKEVPLALLQAVADMPDEALRRGLDHLRAGEFLHEISLFPELEYSFTHGLTHEVAYGGLLQERRRELHARIVEAIETLHRDRLAGEIERLAHHALRGQLREKAAHYLRQAGLKAVARSEPKDALAWLDQALGVLNTLPETPSTLEQAFDIRLDLRPVLSNFGDVTQSLERMREAEILADRLTDDRRRGRAAALIAGVHALLGEPDEPLVAGTRALEIADRLGDLRLRILSMSYLEQVHYHRADYERAVELAIKNLAALPAAWVDEYFGMGSPTPVWDRSWLAMSLAQLGRFAEAAEHAAEARRLAEATQRATTLSVACLAASTVNLARGDWAAARSVSERWIAALRTGSVLLHLPWALAAAAWAGAQRGEASKALERVLEGEQVVDRLAEKGIFGFRGDAYQSLGRACLLLGRLDEGRSLADRAMQSCPWHPGYAAHALHLLADIATHPDHFEVELGEANYRKALGLAEPRGMRPLIAHCHLGLGKLYRRTGRREQAQEHLTTATTMYREMDMGFWLAAAESVRTELA